MGAALGCNPDMDTRTEPTEPLTHEDWVDHLAGVFWEAHAPAMFKQAAAMARASNNESSEEDEEAIREAVRVGIRAVLQEIQVSAELVHAGEAN